MKVNVTIDYDDNAIDLPSMRKMPIDQYSSYIDKGLFYLDHHDALRSVLAEYPVATTSEQIEHLISYLQDIAQQMRLNGK